MSLSAALKAGLGARLKDLSGTGAGAEWDPYPEESGKTKASVPAKAEQPRKKAAAPQIAAERPAGKVAPTTKTPRPANANALAAAKAPAKSQSGKRNTPWLQEKSTAVRVNPQQYARELDRYMAEQNRRQTRETVMEVNAGELEGMAQMAAKARGRYFAKLLDAGAPRQGFLQEAEVEELRFYREMCEEMTRGFEAMRDAIEAGDLTVAGMPKSR